MNGIYPLLSSNVAVENPPKNGGIQWNITYNINGPFSIAMFDYQRVTLTSLHNSGSVTTCNWKCSPRYGYPVCLVGICVTKKCQKTSAGNMFAQKFRAIKRILFNMQKLRIMIASRYANFENEPPCIRSLNYRQIFRYSRMGPCLKHWSWL